MTLIVAAGNTDFIVQVADRRLTFADGQIFSDDEGKAFLLQTPGARMLVSYTGVARLLGDVPTSEVLMKLLAERAVKEAEFDGKETIYLLGESLTEYFAQGFGRVSDPHDATLSVLLVGYVNLRYIKGEEFGEDVWVGPVMGMVTNFQEWGKRNSETAWPVFQTVVMSPKQSLELNEITMVQFIGVGGFLSQYEVENSLRPLLKNQSRPDVIRSKITEVLRRASEAEVVVGPKSSSAVIFRDPTLPVAVGFESPVEERLLPLLDSVVFNDSGEYFIIRDPTLELP